MGIIGIGDKNNQMPVVRKRNMALLASLHLVQKHFPQIGIFQFPFLKTENPHLNFDCSNACIGMNILMSGYRFFNKI